MGDQGCEGGVGAGGKENPGRSFGGRPLDGGGSLANGSLDGGGLLGGIVSTTSEYVSVSRGCFVSRGWVRKLMRV